MCLKYVFTEIFDLNSNNKMALDQNAVEQQVIYYFAY